MKHKIEKQETVVRKNVIACIDCDFCGDQCENPESGDWAEGSWEQDHTYFYKNYYADGECISNDEIDICPQCFEKIDNNKYENADDHPDRSFASA